MIGHTDEIRDDDDLGPPTLVKRLGNSLEGELARGRLAAVGIPSFLTGVDAFHGGPAGTRPVELFVPQSLVHDALDILDLPPAPAWEDDGDVAMDPGQTLAFRALVAAVLGGAFALIPVAGLLIGVPSLIYSLILAARALRVATIRDRTFRLQIVAAIALSLIGMTLAAGVALSQLGIG